MYLDEANFLGIATEALPAAHKAILPDQSMWIPTHTAARERENKKPTITISKAIKTIELRKGKCNKAYTKFTQQL